MWQIQLGNQRRTSNGITRLGCCYCCCCTCPNKWQKTGQKLCICSSLPPPSTTLCFLHCFLALFQLQRQCGFNLQFAAAVIWQIVCRKNKRRRRSSLAPTIQQLRRWRRRRQRRLRRGTDFGRGQFILPGTLLLHPACTDGAIVSGCASDSGSCSDSCRLLPHAAHYPTLSLPTLFAVQRLSEVQIVCQVFSQQLRVFSSAIWSVIELNEQINLWPHSRLSVASRHQPPSLSLSLNPWLIICCFWRTQLSSWCVNPPPNPDPSNYSRICKQAIT